MIKPDITNHYWMLRASDNKVRIVLSIHTNHNLHYTSIEKINAASSQWEHVNGTARGHGDDTYEAFKRIEHLIKTYTVFS